MDANIQDHMGLTIITTNVLMWRLRDLSDADLGPDYLGSRIFSAPIVTALHHRLTRDLWEQESNPPIKKFPYTLSLEGGRLIEAEHGGLTVDPESISELGLSDWNQHNLSQIIQQEGGLSQLLAETLNGPSDFKHHRLLSNAPERVPGDEWSSGIDPNLSSLHGLRESTDMDFYDHLHKLDLLYRLSDLRTTFDLDHDVGLNFDNIFWSSRSSAGHIMLAINVIISGLDIQITDSKSPIVPKDLMFASLIPDDDDRPYMDLVHDGCDSRTMLAITRLQYMLALVISKGVEFQKNQLRQPKDTEARIDAIQMVRGEIILSPREGISHEQLTLIQRRSRLLVKKYAIFALGKYFSTSHGWTTESLRVEENLGKAFEKFKTPLWVWNNYVGSHVSDDDVVHALSSLAEKAKSQNDHESKVALVSLGLRNLLIKYASSAQQSTQQKRNIFFVEDQAIKPGDAPRHHGPRHENVFSLFERLCQRKSRPTISAFFGLVSKAIESHDSDDLPGAEDLKRGVDFFVELTTKFVDPKALQSFPEESLRSRFFSLIKRQVTIGMPPTAILRTIDLAMDMVAGQIETQEQPVFIEESCGSETLDERARSLQARIIRREAEMLASLGAPSDQHGNQGDSPQQELMSLLEEVKLGVSGWAANKDLIQLGQKPYFDFDRLPIDQAILNDYVHRESWTQTEPHVFRDKNNKELSRWSRRIKLKDKINDNKQPIDLDCRLLSSATDDFIRKIGLNFLKMPTLAHPLFPSLEAVDQKSVNEWLDSLNNFSAHVSAAGQIDAVFTAIFRQFNDKKDGVFDPMTGDFKDQDILERVQIMGGVIALFATTHFSYFSDQAIPTEFWSHIVNQPLPRVAQSPTLAAAEKALQAVINAFSFVRGAGINGVEDVSLGRKLMVLTWSDKDPNKNKHLGWRLAFLNRAAIADIEGMPTGGGTLYIPTSEADLSDDELGDVCEISQESVTNHHSWYAKVSIENPPETHAVMRAANGGDIGDGRSALLIHPAVDLGSWKQQATRLLTNNQVTKTSHGLRAALMGMEEAGAEPLSTGGVPVAFLVRHGPLSSLTNVWGLNNLWGGDATTAPKMIFPTQEWETSCTDLIQTPQGTWLPVINQQNQSPPGENQRQLLGGSPEDFALAAALTAEYDLFPLNNAEKDTLWVQPEIKARHQVWSLWRKQRTEHEAANDLAALFDGPGEDARHTFTHGSPEPSVRSAATVALHRNGWVPHPDVVAYWAANNMLSTPLAQRPGHEMFLWLLNVQTLALPLQSGTVEYTEDTGAGVYQ